MAIDNFKSLVGFELPKYPGSLPSFVCLTGLNGAGKTALLQAFDFLAQLTRGQMKAWLVTRDWKASELKSKFSKLQTIAFSLEIDLGEQGGVVVWSGSYNVAQSRCTSESLKRDGLALFELSEGLLTFLDRKANKATQLSVSALVYEGSVLTLVSLSQVAPAIEGFVRFMRGLKSLELLSPHLIRRRSKESADVGYGGEKLSGFLHALSPEQKGRLQQKLHQFYPRLSAVETTGLRAGWKNLSAVEKFDGGTQGLVAVETDARHLNDGMLRILAILAQAYSDHPVVLLDEIENGINAELTGELVAALLELAASGKQIIVTTHSPMILNWLTEAQAGESVFYLYRTSAGHTKVQRFFDFPGARQDLSLLGPGEVFANTSLTEAAQFFASQGSL